MLDKTEIKAVHWQMDDAAAQTATGEIVTDLADLAQSIRQAVLTDIGAVPLSPEQGLDLAGFRDRPHSVRHLFLGAAVRACLDRDVPRVEVEAVTAEIIDFSTVSLTIRWRPRDDIAAQFSDVEVVRDV